MIRRLSYTTLSAGLLLMVVGLTGYLMGIRINTTPSIPKGVYRTVQQPLDRNSFVIFCPPKTDIFALALQQGYITAGLCPSGYGYMMKQVVGMPGDRIIIGESGTTINDQTIPNSKVISGIISSHTSLTKEERSYEIPFNELLLMSTSNPHSFDSRYFGTVPIDHINSVITPLLIWN